MHLQISKKFKRAAVSLSKMCRSKIFVTYIFDNGSFEIWKKGKGKN